MGASSSVEQRWSQRRPVSLLVDIYEQSNLIASSESRDIGLGGVFVNTEDKQFQKDQDVDLFFSLGDTNPTKYKLSAKVVRTTNDGVGFMFKDFDTNAFRALQEIMRHSAHVA